MFINNIKFAKNLQSQSGKVELAKLARVQELDSYGGTLEFKLMGYLDSLNRPTLSLKLYGTIDASCQNCLQPMQVILDNESKLTIFYTEDQLDSALFGEHDSGVEDAVLADEEFDIMQLVEDEVIMLLPCAAKHESCIGLSYQDQVATPFNVLKELI